MADKNPTDVDWARLEAMPEFRALLARKARFIIAATLFFLTYYLSLPVLVGWWPQMMKIKIWAGLNVAYLFALSQFFMAWILAFFYTRAAAGWDAEVKALLAKSGHE
jgi:uncharacterized membrane protein (DUF485 family)